MRKIISEADIGIISLDSKNLNNHFYSKASGQLAELLRFGIPVIVMIHEELIDFISKNNFGLPSSLENLDKAIQNISNNYSYYSKNACDTFNKYYNFENYTNLIEQSIEINNKE